MPTRRKPHQTLEQSATRHLGQPASGPPPAIGTQGAPRRAQCAPDAWSRAPVGGDNVPQHRHLKSPRLDVAVRTAGRSHFHAIGCHIMARSSETSVCWPRDILKPSAPARRSGLTETSMAPSRPAGARRDSSPRPLPEPRCIDEPRGERWAEYCVCAS